MRYILAIDAGTTSVRTMLFGHDGIAIATSQRPLRQIYPEPGMVEHDPLQIWGLCKETIHDVLSSADPEGCAAVAVTNQRETVVAWNRETGAPLCNAIVWQDRRTESICDLLIEKGHDSTIYDRTGLHIDPYFSGTKIGWILKNVRSARDLAASGKLAVGTVDSWIMWNMTGGRVFATDCSNASRTMLFNICDMDWDGEILDMLNIPRCILPEVHPTGYVFGTTDPCIGVEAPIAASMGDQQAALFGQRCFDEGDVKITFGTGGFLLMNVGREAMHSENGLLTTVGWADMDDTCYAIEGSIYIAGAAIQWLRDELQIIEESAETERMAMSVPDTAGCIIVPVFSGLGAPHWVQGARGTIMGLTRGVNRNHLARAALESIAFQAYDVIKAMLADSGKDTSSIRVDGGASANDFLCQFLADITGVAVIRPGMIETTALGVAFEAGLTVGFWGSRKDLGSAQSPETVFSPSMSPQDRENRIAEWSKAVECVKAWSEIFNHPSARSHTVSRPHRRCPSIRRIPFRCSRRS